MANRIIAEDIGAILSRPLPWEDLSGKTILGTGAAGMLASYLVEILAALLAKILRWIRSWESDKNPPYSEF